ncbi:hypothetical protein D3C87_1976320 [compost metagenome]
MGRSSASSTGTIRVSGSSRNRSYSVLPRSSARAGASDETVSRKVNMQSPNYSGPDGPFLT